METFFVNQTEAESIPWRFGEFFLLFQRNVNKSLQQSDTAFADQIWFEKKTVIYQSQKHLEICFSYNFDEHKDLAPTFFKTNQFSTGPFILQPHFKKGVEKWLKKSGYRNLVREKWLTRKKGGFIL